MTFVPKLFLLFLTYLCQTENFAFELQLYLILACTSYHKSLVLCKTCTKSLLLDLVRFLHEVLLDLERLLQESY